MPVRWGLPYRDEGECFFGAACVPTKLGCVGYRESRALASAGDHSGDRVRRRAYAAGASPAGASTLPTGFRDSVVLSGLTNPTVLQFAPDGRIFVGQKNGVIKVFQSLTDTNPVTVADLSGEVDDYWDRGLLGLALAPELPRRTRTSTCSTPTTPRSAARAPTWNDGCPTPPGPTTDGCLVSARVSRLQISGNVMTGSEQVLINDWCQQFPSHSIGTLLFGRDGYLYASGGDGASFNNVDYGQYGATYAGDQANPCGDPPGAVGTALSPPGGRGRRAAQPERPAHRRPGHPRRRGPADRSRHRRGRARQPVLLLTGRQRAADRGLRAAQPVPHHPAPGHRRAVDRRRRLEHLGRDQPRGRAGQRDRVELRLAVLRGSRRRKAATRAPASTCARRCTRRPVRSSRRTTRTTTARAW